MLWDAKVPGLGVRVTPANGRQYVLHYRRNGRSRLMSLGRVEDFRNVTDARDAAREHLRLLRREGLDPLVERRKEKAAGTFSQLVDRWLEQHVDTRCKSRTAADYRGHVTNILKPEFGAWRPRDVTRGEARRLHAKLTAERGPILANRVLATLRAVFTWASKQEDDTLPAGFANPVQGVQFNHERSRREFLRSDELPSLTRELQAESNPWVRGYLWLLLLTGARSGELLALKWRDVDLTGGMLTLRDIKNGEDLPLRLSGAAIDVLRNIPQTSSAYVFPPRREDGKRPHMAKPRVAWADILKRTGISRGITFHDLRRSVGVLLSSRGFTAEQIARQLGHKSNVTAKVYVLIADEMQQKMADALATGTQAAPKKVMPVSIRRRRATR
ncbi:MAG: integrase family protein [Gammaproteobacteria bacterium]|nr:integrase family protein [Gammaproteobacteria bacterium]